jgi:RimJ/RimL family protein N-acetyltransferase
MPLPILSLPLLTPRLLIRAFAETDGDERFAVFADQELRRHFGHGDTRYESDTQLMRDIRDQGQRRWSLAVCDRQSGRMIGACVAREWDRDCELVIGLIAEIGGRTRRCSHH